MKMCRLYNGAIVPESVVNETMKKLETLVNMLLIVPRLGFFKRLLLAELDHFAKDDRYDLNPSIKVTLITFRLLNEEGKMSKDVRDIIQSGLDYEVNTKWFLDPVVEILGE